MVPLCSILGCHGFWGVNLQRFGSTTSHSWEASLRKWGLEAIAGHRHLKPAGALTPAGDTWTDHHVACWEFSHQPERSWQTEQLDSVFSPKLCASTWNTTSLVRQEYLQWSQQLRKSFFFFAQLQLNCVAAKLPFIHTETVSQLCAAYDGWCKHIGWLRSSAKDCW